MLAILLDSFFGIGAVLALAAMIGTWRQYAAAWNTLAAERASDRAVVSRARTPIAKFRTKPLVDRRWPEPRAVA